MRYFIGIDGGGTKTKFTMCREDGTILNSYISSTCHYLQCGLDGMTEVLFSGLRALDPERSIDIAGIFLGCAGYGDIVQDEPAVKNAAEKAVERFYGKERVPFFIGNDCENALAGALGGEYGINVIAGTGSLGCGINENGEVLRCGGWHHSIGSDEGSGYWIGWNMLKEFMRQCDGRDPKTLLYQGVKDALSLKTDDEIISLVVKEWNMDRTKIASLAPLSAELSSKGDPFSKKILEDGAHELFEIAYALKRRLGFEDGVRVSGTGGIFKIEEYVTKPFSALLRKHGMEYVPPMYEPDIGAVILAIKKTDGFIPRVGSGFCPLFSPKQP